MKTPSRSSPSDPKRPGAQPDESGQSAAERAAQRKQRSGEAGLANEARPGLGTRAVPPSDADYTDRPLKPDAGAGVKEKPAEAEKKSGEKDNDRRAPHEKGRPIRPEPREQRSDSYAHDQERSTSASGQSGIG